MGASFSVSGGPFGGAGGMGVISPEENNTQNKRTKVYKGPMGTTTITEGRKTKYMEKREQQRALRNMDSGRSGGFLSGKDSLAPGGLSVVREHDEMTAERARERAIIAEADRFNRQRDMQSVQFAEAKRAKKMKAFGKQFERLGDSTLQFGEASTMHQQPFTQEQDALRSMFGGGEKFWGANDPVHINHDLNPSKNGDYGTADAFGFGDGGGRVFGGGQRSGLF